MGRKPNAVVAEFFARGKKLEDSSNRYQHTCRKCGQLFSKGRVDKLQSHLLKKCPNVTQADRNAVLLAMQQQQQQSSANRTTRSNQIVPLNAFNSLQPTGSQALTIPVSLERQQSALDTLAEVSRRHLDYSSQRDAVFDQHNMLPQDASDQLLAEQAIWAQLRQHTMDLNVPHNQHDLFQLTNQQRGMSSAEDFAANLATANTNTNQLMTNNQHDLQAMTTLDPQLDVEHHHLNLADHVNVAVMPETSMHHDTQNDENVRNALMPWTSDLHTSAIAIPNTTEESNTNNNHPPLRPRARFSDTRRKEVSETRKRGACIRCRMLKKPCSDGTPCTTCAKVDTARLWKTHCIRSKLSEMFKAWDDKDGLFEVQAAIQLPWVLNNSHQNPGEFSIGITLTTAKADIHMPNIALPAHAYIPTVMERVIVVGFHRTSINKMKQGQVFLMKANTNVAKQLAECLLTPDFLNTAIEAESYPFYRSTLQQAQELLSQSTTASNNEQNKTRTSYSLSSNIIQNVLELWIMTTLLTNAHTDRGDIEVRNSAALRFTICAEDRVVAELSRVNNEASYQILELQILGEIETRCAKLSKTVMNDIERHLLQRQSVSGFTTFIAAMILLFCVERTTDFFQEQEQLHHEHSISGLNPNWPIDRSARDIWQKGPSFAALLRMLLYMRGLPPRTYKNENGMMAVIDEPELSITKANGNATVSQVRALDEQRRAAMIEWMEKCNVSYDEVNSWLDEGRESWQGKFVAGLLISTRPDME